MSAQLIDVLNIVIIFAFGISFGSFLNVIIERIPRGLTIDGRSHCPTCLHELGIGDLVPLLSFFLLRFLTKIFPRSSLATISASRLKKSFILKAACIEEFLTAAFYLCMIQHFRQPDKL